MRKLILAITLSMIFAVSAMGQTTDCPSGNVCIPQETANKLLTHANQLIEAKQVIIEFMKERGASDAAIASAVKTIEGWKNLDEVNNMIIVKLKDVVALYEKVLTMYQGLVENLEKQLNKPQTGWQKFLGILKRAIDILAGAALGRVLN